MLSGSDVSIHLYIVAWLPASGSQQNLYSELEIFREITTNKVLVSQASQYILQLVRLLEWSWMWWLPAGCYPGFEAFKQRAGTSHGLDLNFCHIRPAQPSRQISEKFPSKLNRHRAGLCSVSFSSPPSPGAETEFGNKSDFSHFQNCRIAYWCYNKRLVGQQLTLSRTEKSSAMEIFSRNQSYIHDVCPNQNQSQTSSSYGNTHLSLNS